MTTTSPTHQDHAVPHITSVRAALLDTLKHLGQIGRDGKPLDLDQVKAQVSIANAMKGVADSLVDTARVEVDYLKATGAERSDFLEPEATAPKLPAPSATPTPNNPFPVSARNVCLRSN
jgi:hypothetical protein